MSPAGDAFRDRSGGEPERTYFSPGRVNLIGEHTDYNGGLVLPVATHLGCRFAVAGNQGSALCISSTAFPNDEVIVQLETLAEQSRRDRWSDYVVGAASEMLPHARHVTGLDIRIFSDLPHGGGLSSSAAITVGIATLLNDFWQCGLSPAAIARVGQAAENRFVGMNCGILDPFAVAMCEAGHALLIDCCALRYEPVPFPVDTYTLVVAHTGIRRALADSAYNQRRSESEQAAAILSGTGPARLLAQFSPGDLDALAGHPVLLRRARHVTSENERVRAAVAALERGAMTDFGSTLTASHASLRNDYEVSCEELDIMVEEAVALEGAAGAKMTGAGFGGSIVAVVEKRMAAGFATELSERYMRRTNITPHIFECMPASGARRL